MMDSSLRVERFTTITAGDGSATFIICLSHTRCLSTSPLNEKTLIFDLQKLLKFTLKFSDLYNFCIRARLWEANRAKIEKSVCVEFRLFQKMIGSFGKLYFFN